MFSNFLALINHVKYIHKELSDLMSFSRYSNKFSYIMVVLYSLIIVSAWLFISIFVIPIIVYNSFTEIFYFFRFLVILPLTVTPSFMIPSVLIFFFGASYFMYPHFVILIGIWALTLVVSLIAIIFHSVDFLVFIPDLAESLNVKFEQYKKLIWQETKISINNSKGLPVAEGRVEVVTTKNNPRLLEKIVYYDENNNVKEIKTYNMNFYEAIIKKAAEKWGVYTETQNDDKKPLHELLEKFGKKIATPTEPVNDNVIEVLPEEENTIIQQENAIEENLAINLPNMPLVNNATDEHNPTGLAQEINNNNNAQVQGNPEYLQEDFMGPTINVIKLPVSIFDITPDNLLFNYLTYFFENPSSPIDEDIKECLDADIEDLALLKNHNLDTFVFFDIDIPASVFADEDEIGKNLFNFLRDSGQVNDDEHNIFFFRIAQVTIQQVENHYNVKYVCSDQDLINLGKQLFANYVQCKLAELEIELEP